MTRKRLIIGIALLGISLTFGGNAWAGQGQGGKRLMNVKTYHQHYKTPPGHHYRRPVVEKHIYHHYRSEDHQDESRFNIAVSVIDNVLGFAVAVSRAH